jgi:hypothetical protein
MSVCIFSPHQLRIDLSQWANTNLAQNVIFVWAGEAEEVKPQSPSPQTESEKAKVFVQHSPKES